ncbi:RluA family pseudouridine synthase [Pseudoclavibacter caeni]|jgi:23S rRNA pseudouridine1911/1915/1917 synthase|uniref:Pseudouridine synthase n=1 Tax=Pseudoclavibacter caeni TaxID=908846 RepID=A0A7C8BNU0_9MICO|nr:RluA family pseudouridine synthase [Pseudoclavibacter caeni]KAB1632973.1 RluA family pseudouridine synthase [Pseudoclavibacter caeni]NYJ97053.1 23S rRNA pseudouridine1911/1915/1917 synthase [Pseudoclavibacter caeni]
MPSRMLPVPAEFVGVRADTALARMTGLSRARVQAIIAAGDVTQAGRRLHKADPLAAEGLVTLYWEEVDRLAVHPVDVPELRIVHLDDDIVIVDKPVGVVAHPATSWTGPTVLGVLASRGISVARSGPPERQGIVHRLDVGTSGLMIVARSEPAYSVLKRMFREHTVRKTYHAVVHGLPDPTTGTIDAPIGRLPRADWKFGVVAGGRPSVTHYRTLEAFPLGTLVEVRLETGRTHQIRVHMSAVHHPLVGDPLYGGDMALAERLGLPRQWLHAVRLEFDHPVTGEPMRVESEPPEDLRRALALLRDPSGAVPPAA